MTVKASIGAVVAAAGLSRRMGSPKQLLPWGTSTVIETVVDNLARAGADPIVVAVGHCAPEVEAVLAGTRAIVVSNPDYKRIEMLRSYQIGLGVLKQQGCVGALLSLGDQPHIPVPILQAIVECSFRHPDSIIIPSYNRQRGHPFYLPVTLWEEVLVLGGNESLRTVLRHHGDSIHYVNVDTPAVLRDMDTPDDYEALKPV